MAVHRADWHSVTIDDVAYHFSVNIQSGLSGEEILKRRTRYGKNVLEKARDFGVLGKILKQLKSPLVFILLLAGIATIVLKEYLDTLVIFIALFINVAVGVFQEERASKAFEKLNASQERFATVLRDGKQMVIGSEELVLGDIVLIEGGVSVPADMRFIDAHELSVNESVLTGEWVAVPKDIGEKRRDTPLVEQTNMAWMGTLVSSGYGKGVVTAIGMDTKLGAIAESVSVIEEKPTPLQQNVRRVARFLIYIIGFAILIIFILGVLRGNSVTEMLLVSVAVAVASVPEGLPAAVTIVLALGMESILKRGGLVRNLLAAETLGSTTIILTDKTGTLTEAQMKLSSLYTLSSFKGVISELAQSERDLLGMAVLSSGAFAEREGDAVVTHGRPIERAILLAGLEHGLSHDDLETQHKKLDFLSFDSERRFSATLRALPEGGGRRLYLLGAPEYLLEKAVKVYRGGREQRLTQAIRRQFADVERARGSEGMRMIGIAYRDVPWKMIPKVPKGKERLPNESTFVGFLSFSDPVRTDVKEAIKVVKGAGARVVMLTGDNPETAKKVAVDAGIAHRGGRVLVGADVAKMNDKDVIEAIKNTSVFARVLPDQKLRIARLLHDGGDIVAMTGDGINDAPALQAAHIGVAVGSGTEVAKEASDLVLINDSFSVIVAAIEEGRKIVDNLKKIVAYLLSTSFSEVLVIGGALIAGAPLPLLPTQILWANIIEEGFMSFAFAFEGKEKGIMKRDPRSHEVKVVLTSSIKKLIFLITAVTGIFLLILYTILHALNFPIEEIRTFMFAALSLDSIFFAFSFKSLHRPLWRINPFTNQYLLLALLGSIVLLIGALTLGPLQTLLSLTPLSFMQWLALIGVGLFNLAVIEIAKHFIFERR